MQSDGSNRTLTLGLAVALGAALLAVAFLLGRETSRGAPGAEPRPEPVVIPDVARVDGTRERPKSSPWPYEPTKDPSAYRYDEYVPPRAPEPPRLEKRANGTIVISNPRVDPAPPRPSSDRAPSAPELGADDSGRAVSAYFQRMQLVQSASGAGDPNAFAMGMIKAGMGGSTAGFERLAADSERMEEEVKSIIPPPGCERYHQVTLESLVESRELIDRMKTAILARNISELKEISEDAAELQSKADELAMLEKQIRASMGSR